jgi:glutamine synthetase
MAMQSHREKMKNTAAHRPQRKIERPLNERGQYQRIGQYYGECTLDVLTSPVIPAPIRAELREMSTKGKAISRASTEVVANVVTEWAVALGATHFCHWFQPLTGSTAEKHDAFLHLTDGKPIERLGASQLLQGEPDASSFPSGGTRSTFEARGYTSWDLTSPLFVTEGINGKTLNIPTAFVSYHGDALDIKTPLLRSINRLSAEATKFMHLIGDTNVTRVVAACGPEQEYFLIDKGFYNARPDLVMTGRTLFGQNTSRHQQLEDHYFGAIPERVKAFMDELSIELHRLGIPAKTQHNEVAPGQFELAPIYEEANIASDHNQLLMATIKNLANRHDLVALLHEKPFAGVNGSGKHVNWSMGTDTGVNLLDPGSEPHSNYRFLAVIGIIIEAVYRHSSSLRMAIASHGNDHRLGANEAPPSIISVYLGDTLNRIFEAIANGTPFSPEGNKTLDIGANQLANLLQDNTDRNRTSPFAFTGNKFEFRAVGSSQAIGFPVTVLNTAVTDVLVDSNVFLAQELKTGKTVDQALAALTKKWISNSRKVIFNGDGYSQEWVDEAKRRGLPNMRTTPEALEVLNDEVKTKFLATNKVLHSHELKMRYHAFMEKYCKHREIEINCLYDLSMQYVIPAAVSYKEKLGSVLWHQKQIGLESSAEMDIMKRLTFAVEDLYSRVTSLKNTLETLDHTPHKRATTIANDLMPVCEAVAVHCRQIESIVPDDMWRLPKYYDMLFVR